MFAARGVRRLGGPVTAGQFHISAHSYDGGDTWAGVYTGTHRVDDDLAAKVAALIPDHIVTVNRSAVTNVEFTPPLSPELMAEAAQCIGAAIGMKTVHYYLLPHASIHAQPTHIQSLPQQG